MDVDALIAKARENFDKVEPVDQEVLLGDDVVTVRFWPVMGTEWTELTTRNPPRKGSVRDQNMGYNADGIVREYPKVFLVQGDDVVNVGELAPTPDNPLHRKWDDVVAALSGPDLHHLAIAVWGLNDYDPQKRLKTAGKASAGGRKKKPA